MEERKKCYGNTTESIRKGFSEIIVSETDIGLRFKVEEKKVNSPWIEEEAQAVSEVKILS